MPAYCGYARVPIVGMPGHRLRPLFHEIVGWNAMDLMREFLQKSRRGIDKSRRICYHNAIFNREISDIEQKIA